LGYNIYLFAGNGFCVVRSEFKSQFTSWRSSAAAENKRTTSAA